MRKFSAQICAMIHRPDLFCDLVGATPTFLVGIVHRRAVSLSCVAHYLVYGSVTGVTGERILLGYFCGRPLLCGLLREIFPAFLRVLLITYVVFDFQFVLSSRILAALASAELAAACFDAGWRFLIPEPWDMCFALCGWLSFVFVAIAVDSLN